MLHDCWHGRWAVRNLGDLAWRELGRGGTIASSHVRVVSRAGGGAREGGREREKDKRAANQRPTRNLPRDGAARARRGMHPVHTTADGGSGGRERTVSVPSVCPPDPPDRDECVSCYCVLCVCKCQTGRGNEGGTEHEGMDASHRCLACHAMPRPGECTSTILDPIPYGSYPSIHPSIPVSFLSLVLFWL